MNPNSFPLVISVVDDVSVRSATANLLRSCGWTVRICASGIDLLAEINRGDVRLIIADVEMPVMDGFALVEKLGELAENIPVVFITAYATPDMLDKIGHSGAVGFFSKPLDDVRFLAQVAEIVNITGQLAVGFDKTSGRVRRVRRYVRILPLTYWTRRGIGLVSETLVDAP